MTNKRPVFLISLLLSMTLLCTACAPAGSGDNSLVVTTLIYATLTNGSASQGGVDRAAVDRFNRTHTDVQIEVREYFDEDGSNGKDRLLTEIAAGNVPDIIDLGQSTSYSHTLPYQMMVQKGLLENLWPYIENDPNLGRESVVEAPLKAAEVDGGLYVAFDRVCVTSLAGAESRVGNRYSWTLEELQEAFAAMPEGSSILQYFLGKNSIAYPLLGMCIDSYVDWETGECLFAEEKFKSVLEFLNNLPDGSDSSTDEERRNMAIEAVDRLMHGYQMLEAVTLSWPSEIQFLDAYYGCGGQAVLVGYPMEDGETGSSFEIKGPRLAMSSTCKDKDAAWDFIRQMFLPQYKNVESLEKNLESGFPVNRADYDLLKKLDMNIGRKESRSLLGGPLIEFRKATEEEFRRYEDLINHVNKIDL